jgi:hypothetical protein
MNHKSTFFRIPRMSAMLATLAVAGLFSITSCNKKEAANKGNTTTSVCEAAPTETTTPATKGKGGVQRSLSSVVTVAGIRPIEGSTSIEVFFNENTEFFSVSEPALINTVKEALSTGNPLLVTFNPWEGVLISATTPDAKDIAAVKSRATVFSAENSRIIDFTKTPDDVINEPEAMGILNTTDPGLNNLIPDFATAQLMFDYIANQCCRLPGPFSIDYCISFQYCQDGCYARAHKMCWIINNKYKYGTKKIFSFANAGSDKLCVQGQKWGGCCIRWWYHVAPLVTIKTPTGPKAYVFDPAMFNQPVLLATWLHAQENPACATGSMVANVTMINVQPTTSYAPSGSSGLVFGTDPSYTSTNTTLYNYANLVTCP